MTTKLLSNLTYVAVAAIGAAAWTGCLPEAPSAPTTVKPNQQQNVDVPTSMTARQMFNQNVLPLLNATCGPCHAKEVGVGPGFLRSASTDPTVYDPYPVVITWSNFISADPTLSALITKGQHEGPALTMSQYDAILGWLNQEKLERDAVTVVPFTAQVPPFALTLTPIGQTKQYNKIDLSKISLSFDGAYLSFVATPLSGTSGLELSDIRIFNVKPGAMANEQRSIHLKRPLFVMWKNGVPIPDPADSFSATDRTVTLNQNDAPGTPGVLITPGILVLDEYRQGYSMSVLFDTIELVKPVVGGNPCSTNSLNYFNSTIRTQYLNKTTSCAQSGACHNTTAKVADIDMTIPAAALCETMKFYNTLGFLAKNTNPGAGGNAHPFKWSTANCGTAGLAATCYTQFTADLTTWANTQ